MSQSDSATSDSPGKTGYDERRWGPYNEDYPGPALGCRQNWWGTDDDHDLEPVQVRGHEELPGVSRLVWLAKSILLKAGDPTLLCPRCYHELDEASELSEPEDYVPASLVEIEDGRFRMLYTDHRQHRHCTECGHVAWGGILQDRPPEAFFRIVRDVLDVADLPSSTRGAIYAEAQGRKARGVSDRTNMESLIYQIENPGSLR